MEWATLEKQFLDAVKASGGTIQASRLQSTLAASNKEWTNDVYNQVLSRLVQQGKVKSQNNSVTSITDNIR